MVRFTPAVAANGGGSYERGQFCEQGVLSTRVHVVVGWYGWRFMKIAVNETIFLERAREGHRQSDEH